jgi:cell division protein FtsI/penicillin-binding protein 2
MFEAKLNYLGAGMFLVLLVLFGRFGYLQVFAHERYAAQAEQMRTGNTLLEPQRADIVLRDGTVVAHTESVWDIYLDYGAFADPRTIELRAHVSPESYDPAELAEFIALRDELQQAPLPAPAFRRRFFHYWQLRNHPVAQADFELCVQRLCLVTGMTPGEFALQVELVETEVNALLAGLLKDGATLDTAPARDVSVAWLRARPALNDQEYWERIRRFPKSIHFEPVLRARLDWLRRESEYIKALLDQAGGDRAYLRDLCFQAMRTLRERADGMDLSIEPGELSLSQAQDILLEEHQAWLRLTDLCEQVVRGEYRVLPDRLNELTARDGIIRRTEERLDRLQRQILLRYANDWEQRWQHYELDGNPLLLVRDAPRDVVELLKLNADLLPGVTAVRRPARRYAYSRELVHVIGSVGLPDPAGLERVLSRPSFGEGLDDYIERWFDGDRNAFSRRFEGVVAQHLVGRSHLELRYDERLSGLYGARVSTRDAMGRIRAIEYERAPTHPDPLTLTIDIELQRDLIETIQSWEPVLAGRVAGGQHGDRWRNHRWTFRGCAIVLDVNTGAVLAMVSLPDYDPERLKGRSSADRAYQRQFALEAEIEERRDYPAWNRKSRMLNRATLGRYTPGSTFKVLSAAALLDTQTISPHTTFDDVGEFARGRYVIRHNGQRLGSTGHVLGPGINVRRALEGSSNGFFYRWSQDLGPTPQEGWENLRDYAEMFGIGMPMGADFSAARASLPNPERVWAPNLAMLSIGQGAMTATPMEVARMYAAIANRGTLVVPHLSDEARGWPAQIDLPPEVWTQIHNGMRDVVHGHRGTARQHTVLQRINAAGKTGTAENGPGIPNHAWFAGFAPYDNPQVAFVMLAANADVSGADVSPIMGEVLERHFQRTGR